MNRRFETILCLLPGVRVKLWAFNGVHAILVHPEIPAAMLDLSTGEMRGRLWVRLNIRTESTGSLTVK